MNPIIIDAATIYDPARLLAVLASVDIRHSEVCWKKAYPELDINCPYVDYQVVRLYEDLLDILADVMQAIPTELQQYVESQKSPESWEKKLWDVINSADDEETGELYSLATQWWNSRSLSAMHLSYGQNMAVESWRYHTYPLG
jgi:hypothetical protein